MPQVECGWNQEIQIWKQCQENKRPCERRYQGMLRSDAQGQREVPQEACQGW